MANFMTWERDETRLVTAKTFTNEKKAYGRISRKTHCHEYSVPAAYQRIIDQLAKEEEHGLRDSAHEPQRRLTYVQKTLDALYEELKTYFDVPDANAVKYRSAVLTPLLQRQLMGVDENYMPPVRDAISNGRGTPTIEHATEFYLSIDPTEPDWIPTYRRNLIYIPEARWHLGIVMGKWSIGSAQSHSMIEKNTDLLLRDCDSNSDGELPLFNQTEVAVIVSESVEQFFEDELERVVCTSAGVSPLTISNRSTYSPNYFSRQLIPVCNSKLRALTPLPSVRQTKRSINVVISKLGNFL